MEPCKEREPGSTTGVLERLDAYTQQLFTVAVAKQRNRVGGSSPVRWAKSKRLYRTCGG